MSINLDPNHPMAERVEGMTEIDNEILAKVVGANSLVIDAMDAYTEEPLNDLMEVAVEDIELLYRMPDEKLYLTFNKNGQRITLIINRFRYIMPCPLD